MCHLCEYSDVSLCLPFAAAAKALEMTPLETPESCRFNDIMGMLSAKTLKDLALANGYSEEKNIISRDRLLQKRQCCKHSNCTLPTGDADISGSHCNDHSTAGLQQGRHGETAKYFLAHCKHVKERQVKLVMPENVKAKEFENLVYIPQLFI